LRETLGDSAAVPAAPALAAVAGLNPLFQQLLAHIALVRVHRVIGQVERLGIRIRFALELLLPHRRPIIDFGRAGDVGIDVVTAAGAPPTAPTVATKVLLAAPACAALTASAATTSIPVLHSL